MRTRNGRAWGKAPKMRSGSHGLRRMLRLAVLLIVLGIACFGALVGYVSYREAHVPPPGAYDGIIVLGAQVLPTGEPSVQLRWRLDKALEMYRLAPCPIVTCGAQGGNEPAPEGQVMRALLIADGVPPEHVIQEIHSQDTRDNIRNAWAILQGMGCRQPLIVTSDYHLPRALAIAQDQGLPSQGVGSLCKEELEFWMKNHFREALAWVKYWGVKHLGLPL